MSGFDIGAVLREMLSDIDGAAERAVKRALPKAKQDMDRISRRTVKQYYDYYDPSQYTERGGHLYNTYVVSGSSSGKSLTVGTEFSAGSLEGKHQSNSPYHQSGGKWVSWHPRTPGKKYADGTVEADFVFGYFLTGRHPIFVWNGNGYSPRHHVDPKTPGQLLDEYMEEYLEDTLAPFVMDEIIDELLSSL